MQELLTQFGIDWKLLAAQVVNFFILLVILRAFAYKPVLKMLADRRKRIEEGIKASDESKRLLAQTDKREKEIILKAEQSALAIVSDAESTAKKEEVRMIAEAQQKANHVLALGQKNFRKMLKR